MSGGQVFWIVWTALAWAAGVWQVVAAPSLTEKRKRWSGRARQKHAHRPALLRPAAANERPTVLGTRLTGVGFCALGLVGLLVLASGRVS